MADIGYEDVKCHFCGGRNAGYARTQNGKDYDACMKCAKKAKAAEAAGNEKLKAE